MRHGEISMAVLLLLLGCSSCSSYPYPLRDLETGRVVVPEADTCFASERARRYLHEMKRAIFKAFRRPRGVSVDRETVAYLRIERSGQIAHLFVQSPDDSFEGAALAAIKKAAPFARVPDEVTCLTEEQFEVRFIVQSQ